MYDSSYADMATFASVATLASLISTYSLIILAFYVLIIVAQWKIFTKAGHPPNGSFAPTPSCAL